MTAQAIEAIAEPTPAAGRRYTSVAVALHWLIAASIIFNIINGFLMEGWLEGIRRQIVPIHETLGITVLTLSVARLAWRLLNPAPPLNPALTIWEKAAAHSVHVLLYVLMLGMPLVGWALTSSNKRSLTFHIDLFGLIPLPRIEPLAQMPQPLKEQLHGALVQTHNIGAWILMAMLVGHVAGALKHQFLDRHPQFSRIWFGR